MAFVHFLCMYRSQLNFQPKDDVKFFNFSKFHKFSSFESGVKSPARRRRTGEGREQNIRRAHTLCKANPVQECCALLHIYVINLCDAAPISAV